MASCTPIRILGDQPPSLVLLIVLGLVGCTPEPDALRWEVELADSELRTQVARVGVEIRRGGCTGEPLYQSLLVPGEAMGTSPPVLVAATYGFFAEARSASCAVVAEGCAEETLPRESVRVVLHELRPPTTLCAAAQCSDGACGAAPDARPEDCDGMIEGECCRDGATRACRDPGAMVVGGSSTCTEVTQACAGGAWPSDCTLSGYVGPSTEECNGLDDDCDGVVDEGVSPITYYEDGDGDGYGNSDITMVACARPSGHVDDGGDCDDADGTVHPDAVEVCGNGVDDDCNGMIDELPECHIECDWTGARWLSHGYDGLGYIRTGAYFSCDGSRLQYVEWVAGPTAVEPSAAGTDDQVVGCNWGSASRWMSRGVDGPAAFTDGARVSCDGTRVTHLSWEGGSDTGAIMSGDLACNWTGARWFTHGWDSDCAWRTGFAVTCHMARITNFEYVAGCASARL